MKATGTRSILLLLAFCDLAFHPGTAAAVPWPHLLPANVLSADRDTTAGPGPRSAASLVYDERLRRLVLLDGYAPPFPSTPGERWAWDGRPWASIVGAGPPARALGAAVYDSRRGSIISFGGIRERGDGYESLPDTWEWDGTRWANVSPPADTTAGWTRVDSAGPPFRFIAAAAYDTARDRVVLFGGAIGNRRESGDTWEWDGAAWRQASGVGPEARYGHEMVYDERRRRVLLFGGATHQQHYFAETWAWDGAAWTKAADAGPPVRRSHAMAYDRRRGHTLVFGGFDGTTFLNDTWRWDGAQWTQVADSGPAPRYGGRMVYDERRDRFVLFGGIDHDGGRFTDTWEWDGRQWTEVRPAVHPSATHVALAYDPGSARTHLIAGSIGGDTPLREHWTWDGTTWHREPTTFPFEPGAGFDVMVYDTHRGRLLWMKPLAPGAPLETWGLPLSGN